MNEIPIHALNDFHALTPDVIITSIEEGFGLKLSPICRQLNSYINRVFELQTTDGQGLVAKFYRPGRWSRLALQDEHDFLLELSEAELPVVPPMRGADGTTLAERHGIWFALFEKKLGRVLDEPSDEQWEMLGRLMARVHSIGELRTPKDRVTMSPWNLTRDQAEYILRSGVIPPEQRREYEGVVADLIAVITPLFKGIEMIRIHGDCHRGNIVHRKEEALYLYDFDDMAIGPPVQDLWMLLPGHMNDSLLEIDLLTEGYRTFRSIDRRAFRLIEPLRAMRYIHFTAWLAAQSRDGGAARIVSGWGTTSYWRGAIADLRVQIDEVRNIDDMPVGPW